MTTRARIPVRDRFWSKVQKGEADGCWIWTGATSAGYGVIMTASAMIDGKRHVETVGAHRLSYFFATGTWPTEDTRHRCHNTVCVNPAHLVPGTRFQNMQDMVEAGRSMTGELQPMHKLTWAKVRDARRRHSEGVSARQLARDCGVSERTMRQCLARETWMETGER